MPILDSVFREGYVHDCDSILVAAKARARTRAWTICGSDYVELTADDDSCYRPGNIPKLISTFFIALD